MRLSIVSASGRLPNFLAKEKDSYLDLIGRNPRPRARPASISAISGKAP